MNQGQEKFYSFILERVKEEKVEEAKDLLAESFKKQDENSFDEAYLQSFIPRMLDLLKPEHIDKVKAIMDEYGSNFTK